MAAHAGEVLVTIAEGPEEVVEHWFVCREDDVLLTVGVGLDEEEAQHEVGAEVDKENPAREGEDVFEEAGGEEQHELSLSEVIKGLLEDGKCFCGLGFGNIERG